MKKIILILSIVLIGSFGRANAQNDTLAILQNIDANKANYIGQPFSVLLAQIPIGIKYVDPSRGLQHNKNAEPATSFAFSSHRISERDGVFPKLVISWELGLNRTTSAALFSQYRGAWSSTIASNYNSAVISDISV